MYDNNQLEHQTIYAFAHCEAWLESFAKSNQLSVNELTKRVAELLQLQTSRALLGSENSMSSLRRDTSSGNKTSRKMAMVDGSHSKAQINKVDGRKSPKPYTKNRPHWTQTPWGKKKLAKHMRMMRRKRIEIYGR